MQNQACKFELTTVITTTKTFDGVTDVYIEYQRLHTDMYCKTNVFFRQILININLKFISNLYFEIIKRKCLMNNGRKD